MSLEVVDRFLLAKEIDIEQVIAKVDVQGNRIGKQEAIACSDIDREPVITCETRRTQPRD